MSSDVFSKFKTEALKEVAARKEISGFVKSSVLISKDGLFGNDAEEKPIELTEEEKRDKAISYELTSAVNHRSLFEQLQEEKEKKDNQWKEKNNPFQPPRALDDEDVQFLDEFESRQREQEKLQRQQQEEDLQAFQLARMEASKRTVHALPDPQLPLPPKVAETKAKKEVAEVQIKVKKQKVKHKKEGKAKKGGVKLNSSTATLVAYASDENEDTDQKEDDK